MSKEITFDLFIRRAGLVALTLGVFCLVNYLSGVLLPFCVAWLFAYLLYPIVKFVQHKMGVRVRALAIVITMIMVLAVIGGVVYLIIPPMIEQFQKLGDILARWVRQTTHTNDLTAYISSWVEENHTEVERFFRSDDFNNAVKSAMPKLFSFVGQTANVIISIIASMITLLYMFFILLDYEYLTTNWIRIFPKKNRPFWSVLAKDVERELNNYIRGQGLVALCMGVMFCIGFSIMDFPMAIGLGILIGIMDLVPYLHTFALIPTAFLAMLKAADTGQSFWLIFGLAVGLFAVVQLITDRIKNTPDVKGVISCNNSSTNATVEAIMQAGRKDIAITGFDLGKKTVAGFEDGNYNIAVAVQNQYKMGYDAVMAAAAAANGSKPAVKDINTGIKLVDKTNYKK